MAVLACTCQVFICLIKGRFWGWRSFVSPGTGSFAPEGRFAQVGTAGISMVLVGLTQPCASSAAPALSSAPAFCCAIVFYILPKGNGTGYVAAGSGMAHLIGEIIKGFAFTTCQRPLLQTMTLIAVHFWHCLSVADPSAISICSSFSSSLHVLKSNSDPIAPFLSLLYAAYLVWKTEGLAPSAC